VDLVWFLGWFLSWSLGRSSGGTLLVRLHSWLGSRLLWFGSWTVRRLMRFWGGFLGRSHSVMYLWMKTVLHVFTIGGSVFVGLIETTTQCGQVMGLSRGSNANRGGAEIVKIGPGIH
jgi:hypothetical protein